MPGIKRIQVLNDELRTKFRGGKVAITPGVLALGDLPTILKQLREFDSFDKLNTSQHGAGAFTYKGAQHIRGEGPLIFFQIDAYDKELMLRSTDLSMPELTTRLLTIMLAEEF